MESQATLHDGVKLVFKTRGPSFHFFGYYDKNPFTACGTQLLCHRVHFDGRMVEANDVAELGVWNLQTQEFCSFGETRAFNWQQGSMLQWLGQSGDQVIYNDFVDGEFRARVHSLRTNKSRMLPTTVYSVTADGRFAVTPSFRRLFYCRPGYNYVNLGDQEWNRPLHPDDGIWLVDIESRESQRILQIMDLVDGNWHPTMSGSNHYLEHMTFCPSGERFYFYHRWQLEDGGIATRVYTSDRQGGRLRQLPDSLNYGHGCWRNNREVVINGRVINRFSALRHARGRMKWLMRIALGVNRRLPHHKSIAQIQNRVVGRTMLLFDDTNGQCVPLDRNGQMYDDGHCSVNPANPDYVLVDTYPDTLCRQHLMVFDSSSNRLLPLADLYCPKRFHAKGWRCDLHPRWDATGTRVCVDSLQDGSRQLYVYDVSEALTVLESSG